jgi:translation initiation factor IF-3
MIRISPVRVVDENGSQLGVMPTPQALAMAQDRGLDLVEVAPMASPPVVRFLDFGQYKYELAKREKEAKRRSRSVEFKEVRLRPKIGTGDFDTKVHRAVEFLEDGDRIKVTVQFRGREMTHPEIGRALLERFVDRIKDHGVVERAPLMEGRSMHLTVASSHKPKAGDQKAEAKAESSSEPKEGSSAEPKAGSDPEPKAEANTQPTAAAAEPAAQAPAEESTGSKQTVPARPSAEASPTDQPGAPAGGSGGE